MKINIRFPVSLLLRINLLLILTSSVLTVPIANRASGPNFHLLANGSDGEEQTISQFQWSQKEAEVTKARMQVLDHLILGDADDLLSSGAANLPDSFPTAESLVPGQTDSATVQLQEATGTREDVGHTGDQGNADLMQVCAVCSRVRFSAWGRTYLLPTEH
jgi:hypothetical protein